MANAFRRFIRGLILVGEPSDPSETNEGQLSVNSSSNFIKAYINGALRQVVTDTQAQLLSNKALQDTTTTIVDSADNTKTIKFDAGGTASTSTTLVAAQTANRSITLPDATDTLVGKATTDTLTNKSIDATTNTLSNIANANIAALAAIAYSKLNLLNSIVNADIATGAAIDRPKLASGTADHVVINDALGALTSEATLAKSRGGSGQDNSTLSFPATGTLATLAGTETLTNKTFDDAITLTQITSPSNPAAGKDKIFAKSDDKLYLRTSAGVETPVGTGDIVGPASSTDNAVARFDLATGKLLQNSGVIIDDTDNMSGVKSLSVDGGKLLENTATTLYNWGTVPFVGGSSSALNPASDLLVFGSTDSSSPAAGYQTIQLALSSGSINTAGSSGTTGDVYVTTGNITDGTGQSGIIDIETGFANGSSDSGSVVIKTGNSAIGSTGQVTIQTGTTSGVTGSFTLGSGNSTAAATGATELKTGDTDSANSGGITIHSGNSATLGNTGDVSVSTGVPDSGVRGKVTLSANADDVRLFVQPTGAVPLAIATVDYVQNNSGGGINYINNPDAVNTNGWATYKDAAGDVPVNGTGGSPTLNFFDQTTSVLRAPKAFLIDKGASNFQGEGVSYAFSIDEADLMTQLQISFDYKVNAGFVTGDNADVRIFIYDVTNSTLLEPTPFKPQVAANIKGHFSSTFQTSANSTSYRLIFHVATTSTTAYGFWFDNVRVGPMTTVIATPITDYTLANSEITPSAGFGVITRTDMRMKRVGDSLHVFGSFRAGTTAASAGFLTLSTLRVDSSKITTESQAQGVGMGTLIPAGGLTQLYSSNNGLVLFVDAGDLTKISITQQGGSNTFNNTNVSTFMTSGDNIWFEFAVPILGWSTNILMSADSSTRVIAAKATKTATQSIANSTQAKVTWGAKEYDTLNSLDIVTNNRFTAPVSGKYHTSGTITWAGSATGDRYVYLFKNGAQTATMVDVGGKASGNFMAFAHSLELLSGDYIEIFVLQNSGGGLDVGDGTAGDVTWAIERVSGPEVVLPNEKIQAKYQRQTAQSISNNTATAILFDVKDTDTHGAFNTANGRFTAPIKGTFHISAYAFYASAAGGFRDIQLYKNGALVNYLDNLTSNNGLALSGSIDVDLNSGDYIEIITVQSSGGSINIDGATVAAHVSIHLVK